MVKKVKLRDSKELNDSREQNDENNNLPFLFCCFDIFRPNRSTLQRSESTTSSQINLIDTENSFDLEINITQVKVDEKNDLSLEVNTNTSVEKEIKNIENQEILQTEYSCSPGSLNRTFSLAIGSQNDETNYNFSYEEEEDHPGIIAFFKSQNN
eukprot:gene2933-4772_t